MAGQWRQRRGDNDSHNVFPFALPLSLSSVFVGKLYLLFVRLCLGDRCFHV